MVILMTGTPETFNENTGRAETPQRMEVMDADLKSIRRRNVAMLVYLLKSPHQLDREKAAEYLGEIGDPDAVPALVEALADPTISWLAAESLGKIGDVRAVEPLIAVLNSDEKWLRRNAAEALGKLRAASAVEPIIRLLGDKKHDVREVSARALGQIGDVRAVPALQGLSNDPDVKVRETALASITMINQKKIVS
jgi:HEAT repeat protein